MEIKVKLNTTLIEIQNKIESNLSVNDIFENVSFVYIVEGIEKFETVPFRLFEINQI